MSGGKPWATRGTRGSEETLAVNDRPEFETKDVTQTSDVASGGTEVVEVYAPTDSLYRLLWMDVKVQPPGSATANDHRMEVKPADPGPQGLIGFSDYQTKIEFNNRVWQSANSYQQPSNEAAQGANVAALRASNSLPLTFKYSNNTDVTQSNQRRIRLVLERSDY